MPGYAMGLLIFPVVAGIMTKSDKPLGGSPPFLMTRNLHYLCGPQSRGGAWPSPVKAPGLGPGDRRFESCRPDYKKPLTLWAVFFVRESEIGGPSSAQRILPNRKILKRNLFQALP